MARQSPDRSCIAPQILKTSEDLQQQDIWKYWEILRYLQMQQQDIWKMQRDIRTTPAHEEEDEGDDAEDDDDDRQAGEHCRSSGRIRSSLVKYNDEIPQNNKKKWITWKQGRELWRTHQVDPDRFAGCPGWYHDDYNDVDNDDVDCDETPFSEVKIYIIIIIIMM